MSQTQRPGRALLLYAVPRREAVCLITVRCPSERGCVPYYCTLSLRKTLCAVREPHLRGVGSVCGSVRWSLSVPVYGGLCLWQCTLGSVCASVRWALSVAVYGGLCLWQCTVGSVCASVRWALSVPVYGGLCLWQCTVGSVCASVRWCIGLHVL